MAKAHNGPYYIRLCLGLLWGSCGLLRSRHAYNTLLIAPEQKKYLTFTGKGRLLVFRALPVSLTSSPRIFARVMKSGFGNIETEGPRY